MTLQLPQGPQGVCVPQLEHATSAAAKQGRGSRDNTQSTNPVTVGVWDLLLERRTEKMMMIDVNPLKTIFIQMF